MAYNLLSSFTKPNTTLINNLKAIVFSKLGRYNEAYSTIENILKIKPKKMQEFDGHLFPFTLKCFQEAIDAEKAIKTEMNETNFQKLISLSSSRIFKYDIFEYCIRINQK